MHCHLAIVLRNYSLCLEVIQAFLGTTTDCISPTLDPALSETRNSFIAYRRHDYSELIDCFRPLAGAPSLKVKMSNSNGPPSLSESVPSSFDDTP